MPTVVTTPGAANANSYATVAEIDTYAEGTAWAAAWVAKTDDERDALAIRAARAIDALAFPGYPTSDTQALQFPRTNVPTPFGTYLDSATVPELIKRVQAHVAAYLASFASTVDPFSVDDTGKLSELSVGPISLSFRASVGPDGGTFLATVIIPLLRPWIQLSPSGSVRLVR